MIFMICAFFIVRHRSRGFGIPSDRVIMVIIIIIKITVQTTQGIRLRGWLSLAWVLAFYWNKQMYGKPDLLLF